MIALYLVRHAIAQERGPAYPDDNRRPLSPRGRARMRTAVKGLRKLDPDITLILTSPLTRARQTARLLQAGLTPAPEIVEIEALRPGRRPQLVAAALGAARRARALALVGHEPGLGQLAAWLIGARRSLPFRKGGIARIDVPKLPPTGAGHLIWFATPKMLRALAKDARRP